MNFSTHILIINFSTRGNCSEKYGRDMTTPYSVWATICVTGLGIFKSGIDDFSEFFKNNCLEIYMLNFYAMFICLWMI